MLFTRVLAVLAFVSLGAALAGAQRPASNVATLILTGGKVYTADSTRPWAEALAVTGDRIVAVGSTTDVRRLAGAATREIALAGRVVIPGINDAHDHLGDLTIGVDVRTDASPTPDPTTAHVLDSVRVVAARAAAGAWIKVTIGRQLLWIPLRAARRSTVSPRAIPCCSGAGGVMAPC